MGKKKTKEKKAPELRADDARPVSARDTLVEAYVGARCQHECFCVTLGSPVIWRFEGAVAFAMKADEDLLIHAGECDDHEWCLEVCWDEGANGLRSV